MIYADLFKSLSERKVRYLICGGLAVNIYGIPRMTADIDLLIDLTDENIKSFEDALDTIHYKPVLPIKLAQLSNVETRNQLRIEKNMIAFSFYNHKDNLLQIDLLLHTPIPFEEMWMNKVERQFEDFKIQLISVEHLIVMKEYAGRVQDLQDVKFLKQLKKNG